MEDQVKVSKKALAYVELLITSTCAHLLKSPKFVGNPVQAYLDTLTFPQVIALKKDVEGALEQCEDSNRYMAVYSGGDDLARRIRQQCFTTPFVYNLRKRARRLSDIACVLCA